MGKWEKLLEQILHGKSDANIPFHDLARLLERLGFVRRTRGSHHVFRREGITEKPILQQDGSKAKPYQVKQVRDIILKYKLGDDG
jgi:predicted RNA binding protein YcfA (HicA-like mRNA interferase family)